MGASQSIPDAARRMTAPLVASGAMTASKQAEIIASCELFGAPGRAVPIVRAGSGGGGAPSLNSSSFTSVAAVSFAAQSHLTAAGAEAATADKAMGADLTLPDFAHKAGLFGICEGHDAAGVRAAAYVRGHLHEHLAASLAVARAGATLPHIAVPALSGTRAQIHNAFMACDAALCVDEPPANVLSSGATAAFLFVRRADDGTQTLYTANVGDVEIAIGRGPRAAPTVATTKHDLETPAGQADARSRGATLFRSRGRTLMNPGVGGAYVRSFGNADCKPAGGGRGGTAEPSQFSMPLTADCDFAIIATEAFWRHVPTIRAVDHVYRETARGGARTDSAEALKALYMQEALAHGDSFSHDASVLVVWFNH